MAKEKKSAAAEAAAQAASKQKAPENNQKKAEEISLNTIVGSMRSGSLSQDGKAITANLVQKRWVEGENIPDGIRDGAGKIVDAFLGDIIATDIAQGSSISSHIIRNDPQRYLAIKGALAAQGIVVPDLKELPAPTKEQLDAMGVKLLPSETAVLSVKAENVDKKVVEKKKKELEAVKNAVDNPADVENEEQLKASLTAMLVKPIANGPDGPDARLTRTVGFYRGYLTIQANKIEDEAKKKEALAALKAKTLTELLNEIAESVGSCPFAIHGSAYMLRNRTNETGNPLAAFCLYRRTAASSKNGTADDQQIADIVRTLVVWSCKSVISDNERNIKEAERLIKKNEEIAKGEDKNEAKVAKAAIKKWQDEIENKYKPVIASMQEIIEMTANPKFDVVDNLITNYNGDENSEEYKLARRMVDDIMKTYYKELNRAKLNEADMLAAVQQRAGVILNMFHSPLNQNQTYSEAYINELKEVEKPAKEEEKAE